MNKLKVDISFRTDLYDMVEGFLFCTDNTDKINDYFEIEESFVDGRTIEMSKKLNEKGKALLVNNLVNTTNPHTQVMNQMQIKVKIFNTTRAVLIELSRHRIGWEILVLSTRYALHKIAKDAKIPYEEDGNLGRFIMDTMYAYQEKDKLVIKNINDLLSKYYFIPEDDFINDEEKLDWIQDRLIELINIKHYKIKYKMKNDKLKKYINEYMKTDILVVCSGQALRNFLTKRLSNKAFSQIRTLAQMMYDAIPDEYKFLFKVFTYEKLPMSNDDNDLKIMLSEIGNKDIYYKKSLIKE